MHTNRCVCAKAIQWCMKSVKTESNGFVVSFCALWRRRKKKVIHTFHSVILPCCVDLILLMHLQHSKCKNLHFLRFVLGFSVWLENSFSIWMGDEENTNEYKAEWKWNETLATIISKAPNSSHKFSFKTAKNMKIHIFRHTAHFS